MLLLELTWRLYLLCSKGRPRKSLKLAGCLIVTILCSPAVSGSNFSRPYQILFR